MKIENKKESLQMKRIESSGQNVKGGAKPASEQVSALQRTDRVTISGDTEVSKAAREIVEERRKKIEEIQSLLRAGGAKAYFDSRPGYASGVAQGLSSEVTLMQELVSRSE